MQAVHELGHVVAAWLSGGTVQRVILNPFTISRTDVSPNPHPLIVAWAGPLVGVGLPLIAAACSRPVLPAARRFLDFFAGFCLIANGTYIGVGSLDAVGDAGDMLRLGSPRWLLAAFGIFSATCGLWIWHRLTKRENAPSALSAD
ncbi:MAG: M50 family metallopeptidase [Pirellulales bacterium]|nr:M50 family metallopeptidase [Pirellulales bacterium]